MNSIDEETLTKIVTKLRERFETGVTRSTEWRDQQIDRLERMITENEEQWRTALKKDLKQNELYLNIEIQNGLRDIFHLKHRYKTLMKQEQRKVTNPDDFTAKISVYYEPYGVVLIFAPWNFPVSLLVRPLVGALAAGNTVLVKPSEVSVNTSHTFADLIGKYFEPEDVCCVEGDAQICQLILKQRFNYIFYTGNEFVGRKVMKAASEHLTPVTLELGGKNPTIITHDTNIATTAKRVMFSKLVNCGQICIAPDYCIVHHDVVDQFIEEAKKCVNEFHETSQYNIQDHPDYGRIINEKHANRLKNYIDEAKSTNQEFVMGGQVDVEDRFVEPTIVKMNQNTSISMMKEEIFGPILPILEYGTEDSHFPTFQHVVDYINRNATPLALYAFTNDNNVKEILKTRTQSGGLSFNECIYHVAELELPFGGINSSGIGRYGGDYSFYTFSHEKPILDKKIWSEIPMRYPPYHNQEYKSSMFRSLLSDNILLRGFISVFSFFSYAWFSIFSK